METTEQAQARRRPMIRLSEKGLAAAGLALLLAATLLLSMLAAGDNTLRFDVSITKFIQDYSSRASDAVADFGNAFGAATVGVPLGIGFAALLSWRGYPRGAVLLLAATSLRVVNYGLKVLFDSPRPTPDLVRVESTRTSNGFPSGHAQGATLLCGALLIALWPVLSRGQRVAACFVASSIVLVTGYARVSVGAHWPSDVLGGTLWGTVLIGLLALTIKPARPAEESPGVITPGDD